ncbi:TetR/AcrR family transcriptional regulator [Adhaeribacter sp. BT258]|uniref:TetR/AcrR family transcriptional regulator n=1 Tax=Adhaeribacter terrigena TaxID=2793070 RepID=A0ABS1C4A5_9BACT|nr:helix-turn-helix domain-containing protein [Adhaeribacter terrigena]MBK0404229.1 TetR/AcrR family transcriptional regulator [Adhaeribacter terrigena]
MTFKETLLDEALALFQQEGVEANTEPELRSKLDISQATFNELFASKASLVRETVLHDIEKQKKHHLNITQNAHSAIEEILILLQDGIKNIKVTNPAYVTDLQQHYPEVWEIALDHLNTYSYHQIYDILNRGVQAGEFRKDINLQLVTKIMLEMVGLLLNPQTFPPDRYNLSEVYRSIYLYYIRGICTDSGSKVAEKFFSTYNI